MQATLSETFIIHEFVALFVDAFMNNPKLRTKVSVYVAELAQSLVQSNTEILRSTVRENEANIVSNTSRIGQLDVRLNQLRGAQVAQYTRTRRRDATAPPNRMTIQTATVKHPSATKPKHRNAPRSRKRSPSRKRRNLNFVTRPRRNPASWTATSPTNRNASYRNNDESHE